MPRRRRKRRNGRPSFRRWSRSASRSRRSDRRSAPIVHRADSGPGASGARPAHFSDGRDQRHARFLFRRRQGARSRRRRATSRRRWRPPAPTSSTSAPNRRGPGATPVGAAEELARVEPAVTAIAAAVRIPISIDTYKAVVAGGRARPRRRRSSTTSARSSTTRTLAPLVAARRRAGDPDAHARAAGRHVCACRIRGRRRRGVSRDLRRGPSIGRRDSASTRDRLIVDPGLGFAKRAEQSLTVLAGLERLGGARPADPGRPFAQVLPDRRRPVRCRPTSATGRRPRRSRPPCSRAPTSSASTTSRRWFTSCASPTPFDSRQALLNGARRLARVTCDRISCGRRHEPLRAAPALRRTAPTPARHVVGRARHPDRLDRDLRAAEAHPRHARGADGGRHRVDRRPVLPVAGAAARNAQLADSQHHRLRRVCGHRAAAGGHPPRARSPGPRQAVPAARPQGQRRRHGRGAGGGGDDVVGEEDRRDYRDRAIDRPSQLHRERHSARCQAHLRSAGQHLSADLAASRRRGDRAGRSRGGGRLFPAADDQPATRAANWDRGIAPRSASPKKTMRWRSSCRRKPGRISIVEDGDLEYDIDADRLRTRLQSVVTLRRARGKQRQAGYSFG